MNSSSNATPRRLGSAPREVRLTPGATAARIILWLGAIGLPAGLVIGALVEARELTHYRDSGAVAEGRIIKKSKRRSKSTSYYLHYDYPVAGERHRGRDSVSRRVYDRARIGDPLPITYRPEEPGRHRVGLVDDARIARERNALLIGGLAAFLGLGFLLTALEIMFGRSRRLLRDGRAVVATIDELTPFGARKRGSATVRYSYRTPSGKVLNGKARVMRIVPPEWNVGTEITVVQDKENPGRSAPPESLVGTVRLA